MRIDGREIAREILDTLTIDVAKLKAKGITPTLAVILVGDDPSSLSFIKQKKKAGETIGADVIFSHQPLGFSNQQLRDLIDEYNTDPKVHGIIIQRPVPGIDSTILTMVTPTKDVDGFVVGTKFEVPVALAVVKILEEIHKTGFWIKSGMTDFTEWLKTKNIVAVGRGETAGGPIAAYLGKLHCATTTIHSQTPHPEELLKHADIVISCSGKRGILTRDTIKPNTILVGVGVGRDDEQKLQGDYNEEEIQNIASYYTPTPGGVGPVNVACLMENVVKAAQNSAK